MHRKTIGVRTLLVIMAVAAVSWAFVAYLRLPFWGGRRAQTKLVECYSTPRALVVTNRTGASVYCAAYQQGWCHLYPKFLSHSHHIPPHQTIELGPETIIGGCWKQPVALFSWNGQVEASLLANSYNESVTKSDDVALFTP